MQIMAVVPPPSRAGRLNSETLNFGNPDDPPTLCPRIMGSYPSKNQVPKPPRLPPRTIKDGHPLIGSRDLGKLRRKVRLCFEVWP